MLLGTLCAVNQMQNYHPTPSQPTERHTPAYCCSSASTAAGSAGAGRVGMHQGMRRSERGGGKATSAVQRLCICNVP